MKLVPWKNSPLAGRRFELWDELKASFGLPAGLAMLAGALLGSGLPTLDRELDVAVPTLSIGTQEAATGLLETIATATVSVAGLAFSVTVVAFTLTSSQLSPRVLRSFRSDRLSQAVLALFLGTFVYCLSVLVRLGGREEGVPNLSMTVALLLGFASFMLFAVFVAHILRMLQPSTVIATIVSEAKGAIAHPFPSEIGAAAAEGDGPISETQRRMDAHDPVRVEAEGEGYLRVIRGEQLIALAREHHALVRQRVAIGDYVTPADVLAEVWVEGRSGSDAEALVRSMRGAFVLGRQRSLVQDVAFPVRQLADVALKGLSTGVNDPTTAENAMEALTAVLVRFARSDSPHRVRLDSDGEPRFVADPPVLDDLIHLGFEQVRICSASDPVVSVRLLELLELIAHAAEAAGVEHAEAGRQSELLREGALGEVPTEGDRDRVRRAHRRAQPPAS